MKIVLVITGLGVGGAEKVVVGLADKLIELGNEVAIVYLVGEALVRPKSKDVLLIPIRMKSYIYAPIAAYKIKCFLKEFLPDVVHSHMYHSNILMRILRFFIKIPTLVCTAHSNNEGGIMRMALYRATNMLADFNTNVSVSAVKAFEAKRAVPLRSMLAVANGIDCNNFFNDQKIRITYRQQLGLENLFVIVSVGRLEAVKDYPNLLKAVSIVQKDFQNIRLLIVGDGSLNKELKDISDSLGISSLVQFLGVRDDISNILNVADLFVLTSINEGFGLVVAEAMACEKVVISTKSGGANEIIDNENFVVPVSDFIALSDKIKTVLSMTQEERSEIGLDNRKKIIENYSFDKMCRHYLKLYSDN